MTEQIVGVRNDVIVCPDCGGIMEYDTESEDNWDGEYMHPSVCTVCGLEAYVVKDSTGSFIRVEAFPPM